MTTLPPLGPMRPAGLNFDQTVQFASDQFEVELNSSQAYTDRVELAALSAGLLDPYLVPDLVELISGGIVFDVELHVFPNKYVSVVRGRDKASLIADSAFKITYSVKVGTVAAESPSSVPGFPNIPAIPGVTVPLVIVRAWRASEIAKDLCTRAGLSLSWDTYDYQMREDTVVDGSVFSTIQSLIEPFSHFERSKTDVWEDHGTVVVRRRRESTTGVEVDAHDSRIIDLVLHARYNSYVRMLRLSGTRTGTSPYVAVDPGDQTLVTENETVHPVTGDVTLRTITSRTTRIRDGACKREVVETYRDALLQIGTAGQFQLLPMHLVARETTVSDWDDLQLAFPNVILNKPKENSRVTTREAFDPNGGSDALLGILAPQSRTSIMNSYDAEGYIRAQDTRKEVWDLPPGSTGLGKTWVLDKMETKKYDRNGAGMYQITTTQYGSDGVAGDSHRTVANGTPPGGPGRGSGGSGSFQGTPVTYGILVSTHAGAKDITIDNPNLLYSDLQTIAAQAVAASGSTEIEISFCAAGMPWIKRGQYITLTGLTREDGTTPIVCPPALVTEARVEYREQGEEPTYLTYVKALFWE